ncbi:MAG: hypothetical protein JSR18_06415, partial [Proteobacteria bacterium]|nr:hypothetical protein [Pseudomonadota bacterium]
AVQERYPGVAFQIVSDATDVNFPRLLAGELDMLFGVLPPGERVPDHLVARAVTEVALRVIAARGHPLCDRSRVEATDLTRYPWAVMQHDRELVASLVDALRTDGVGDLRIAVEATSLSSLVRLLKSGPYLSCVAEGIGAMPEFDLAFVPYRQRIVRGAAGVVMHRSLASYAPATLLVEHVAARALPRA